MKTYYATDGGANVHAFHGSEDRDAWVEAMRAKINEMFQSRYQAISAKEAREMCGFVGYIVLHIPRNIEDPWNPDAADMAGYPKWLVNLASEWGYEGREGYLPENGGYTYVRDQRHPY